MNRHDFYCNGLSYFYELDFEGSLMDSAHSDYKSKRIEK